VREAKRIFFQGPNGEEIERREKAKDESVGSSGLRIIKKGGLN